MRIFIDITSDQSGGNFVPATVQNLQATLLSDTVQVSWDEFVISNGERDGEVNMYQIERKVNEGAWQLNREFEEEDWATGFLFSDLDIEGGNTYYYRIKALTTKGKETDWSKIAEITLEGEEIIFNPPSLSLELKPTGIQVTWVVDSNNTIPTTNNQSEVIKDSEAPTFGNLAAESDTALYSTVVEGSTYKFRIRAYNEDHGYSEWSDQKTMVFNPEPLPSYDRIEQHTYTSTTSAYNGQTIGVEFYFTEEFRENPTYGFRWKLFFHGAGENGNADFAKLGSASGYPRHTRVNNNDVPYNVVSIQCPGQNWTDEFLQEGIAFAVSICPYFDPNKFMISGWSQGGVPVYAMLSSPYWRPKVAAAVAFSAVAGVSAADRCPSISDEKGVWIIVANDDSYGTGGHTAYFGTLKTCPHFDPVKHRRTLYVSGGHDCVNRTLTGSGGSVVDANDDTVISGDSFHQWLVDRYDYTAPSVPTGLSPINKTALSITLGWVASTDDRVGVKGYIVSINNEERPLVAETQLSFFGLSEGTEYTFKVKAIDFNNNESAWSTELKVTTDIFDSEFWMPEMDNQDFRLSTVDNLGYSKDGSNLISVTDRSTRGSVPVRLENTPIIENGTGGKEVIHLRSANSEKLFMGNASYFNHDYSSFIMLVCKFDPALTPTNQSLIGKGNTGHMIRKYSTQAQVSSMMASVPSGDIGRTNVTSSDWLIMISNYKDGVRQFRVNGEVKASVSETATITQNTFEVSIGGNSNQNSYTEIWVHEAIISLGKDEDVMEKYEGWAAWEYGLVDSLPVGHPYKDAPPPSGL